MFHAVYWGSKRNCVHCVIDMSIVSGSDLPSRRVTASKKRNWRSWWCSWKMNEGMLTSTRNRWRRYVFIASDCACNFIYWDFCFGVQVLQFRTVWWYFYFKLILKNHEILVCRWFSLFSSFCLYLPRFILEESSEIMKLLLCYLLPARGPHSDCVGWSEFLTAVTMKSTAFWVVTSCSL